MTNRILRRRGRPARLSNKAAAVCAAVAAIAACALALPLDYRASVTGVLDNREYGGPDPLVDETFFLVRPEAELGLTIDGGHKIFGGFMYTKEFGARDTLDNLELLVYYRYDGGDRLQFRFGSFPRADAPDLPPWFFGAAAGYRRPFIQGAAVEAALWDVKLGAWVDWMGRQSRTVREAFLYGYGMSYGYGPFFARHDFIMYHRAHTRPAATGQYLRDNGGLSFEAGAAWGGKGLPDTLSLSAGGIASFDRLRSDYVWYATKGGFASVYAARGIIATRCFLYAGEPQMFYWHDDFFYLPLWFESFNPLDYGLMSYGRIDMIARLVRKENIKADLFGAVHFYRGKVGTSQHFQLRADIKGAKK